MSRVKPLCVLSTSIALALLFISSASAAETTLTVHVDKPGIKISPVLYGIFFEEINRAGEGGLYGEMVQNRSFEDDRGDRDHKPTKAPAWSLVLDENAKATMTIDNSHPLNAHNPHALKLDVVNAGHHAGVANEGFRGMAVSQGASYALSFYARCSEHLKGPIEVSLQSKDGTVLGSAAVNGIGGDWKQFRATLNSNRTNASARLVLSVNSSGTLWLDDVSLFPAKTWKNRPNGLRPDLAEMLFAMKPSFNRFPGGCYVEGNRLANAFRWKNSIGELSERPGHWNLWGYRSTDGLGYYEYLQMCEDLGTEPLFVINCGMSHEEQSAQMRLPVANVDEYLQDALDAIEYANGPVESKWGGLRAKAGHPAPFNLKYMEVGNENSGPVYEQRYKLFYDAIKAKYPDIKLVANAPVKSRPMDILDEHYYSTPEFFMANADRYDKYDRAKSPKIYVGEYAVTQGCGKGNLRAAIGEAAFMAGMERNSDVVVMASYAPLFVHYAWRQWNPNAINFDGARAYGTPSYHLQKMFSRDRGDVILGLDFDAPKVKASSKHGAIGVGTWLTQAEYKDIKVTQGDKVLFQSDFSKDHKGWRTRGGLWQVNEGALQQTSEREDVRAIAGDKSWKDYTLTLKARKIGGAEGFLILFNVQNDGVKSWWNIGGWGNSRHALEIEGIADEGVAGKIEAGRWYDIRIETRDGRIRCYLDDKLIHDVNQGTVRAMYAGASQVQATGDVILKVVNQAETPQSVRIALTGNVGKVTSGAASVLTSPDQMDENSLEEPEKVVPKDVAVPDASDNFVHEFPAGSVTVMRLKVK